MTPPLDAELTLVAETVTRLPRDAAILLVCHVNPDGDALGSMLGFGLGLRQLGFTRIQATYPEPYELAEVFGFLPGLDLLVPPAQATPRPDLAVSFDAASESRLGELVPALHAAPDWIVLDHHISNTGFGTIRLVDPDAAATAEVASRVLDRIGVKEDEAIATCLYVGIATDTGSFKFDATTPDVFALAARFTRAGVRAGDVARHVFDSRSFAVIQLMAEVLSRAELDEKAVGGRGMVSAYATLADLKRYGQPANVLESFMDVVRTAREADVACLVKPVSPGVWTISLRSKGATDVSRAAVALGGGGHRLAAGFTGYGTVDEILTAVRARLEDQG